MIDKNKSKERILTEKEKIRAEHFNKLASELEQQGYEKKDLTVGIVAANIYGTLLALPFGALFLWLFVEFGWKNVRDLQFGILTPLLFLIMLFAFIVIHELIHGLTWGIFASNHFKSIEFGVIWKMLTPYCTCSEPLGKWQYIIGAAMPTIVLGFIVGAISIFSGSTLLAFLAFVMIFAGAGDLLIVIKMLIYRSDKKDQIYIDHPYELGLAVFER